MQETLYDLCILFLAILWYVVHVWGDSILTYSIFYILPAALLITYVRKRLR